MKRITLLAMLSVLPHVVLAQNHWSATCTDKAGRSSSMSVSVERRSACKTTITGDAPTQRADGSKLALTDLSHCTVYRARSGGVESFRIAPAAKLEYVHNEPALCPQPPPVVTPPTQYPAPAGFKIAGTTASCTTPADAKELRMFTVRADGKLGDRVKTFRRCPTTYAFVKGRRYVLKAVYANDKLSPWSNTVTAP